MPGNKDDRVFKRCQVCNSTWVTCTEFLEDYAVDLVGYQVDFEELVAGLFLFNHACGATLAIQAAAFRDLYDGPVFSERRTGTSDCPGHCLHESELAPCPAQCECAYVREIVQIVNGWQKQPLSKVPDHARA